MILREGENLSFFFKALSSLFWFPWENLTGKFVKTRQYANWLLGGIIKEGGRVWPEVYIYCLSDVTLLLKCVQGTGGRERVKYWDYLSVLTLMDGPLSN